MNSSNQAQQDVELGPDGRPDFLVKLGVLLPCSPDDVKQAYLSKVRSVHPDVGGTQAQFIELQQAFERATEYANFLVGRRKWLSAQVERYVEQEITVSQIQAAGGTVKFEHKDWLSREIGADFAQVLDTIVELRWTGPDVGDEQIDFLVEQRNAFATLRALDLSQSQLTDAGVQALAPFANLERLNLSGTPITHHALAILESLPNLAWLNLRGTHVGSFRLYFYRRNFPELEIEH